MCVDDHLAQPTALRPATWLMVDFFNTSCPDGGGGGGGGGSSACWPGSLRANPNEGLVSAVCPKRGCWFDMAGEKPGDSMRFKVKDWVMVFPMEASGKYAVAQGTVRKMPMTLEQSKRWATYQRDSYGADIDPDAITEPLTIVRLDGSGAVIRDAK